MSIKDYIIQNFKDDNEDVIKNAIDESVREYNEKPGGSCCIFCTFHIPIYGGSFAC